MLTKTFTGTWLPAWVPESTNWLSALLILCSMVQSTTWGYDGSMMNGLNILPSYKDYFQLTPVTTGLNTAATSIGSITAVFLIGFLLDRAGRRPAILWGSIFMLVSIILQTSAQNMAMFVVSRVILGFGHTISGAAGGIYLSETFPSRWRAWGTGLLNDCYYVGALMAAGITLGTGQWQSTWAWRAPSLFQAVFSLVCIIILPFVPESPRWLVHQGHYEAARTVVAQANSNGDIMSPLAITVYRQIVDTIEWEKKEGRKMSPMEIIKNPVARKRVLIGGSAKPFSCIAGNVIASYYLGAQLTSAGITARNDQLKANVVLNVWCLFTSLVGTHLAHSWGRKTTALLSQSILIVCLFIIGGLTKMYGDNPQGASHALVYGNVAVIFIFQGAYSLAWTPLLYLYPSEVMNYSIRANGTAAASFSISVLSLVMVFVMPIGLANIGWKMYMVNGSWDIATLVLIAIFWVETKGKSLEEIDALFDKEKHTNMPDEEQVRAGKETVDVQAMKGEMAYASEQKSQ
ncbi:putative sugar transporter [Thozetella sp. PMI_491]|nr:putative sugar transporter [Thozetella sp. PMI_491]